MTPALAQYKSPVQSPKGEMPSVALGLSEFRRISKIMKTDAGIMMTDDKVNLVHARLQKRLRALSISSFKSYCQLVESGDGKDERKIMMNALTTNLTRFFREPHHFKHLISTSLPPLIAKAKSGGRVRIWSAGCSTGEEAYSIASVLHSMMPTVKNYDVKILASDIDSNVIQTGRAGIYSSLSVDKMPEKLSHKYFDMNDRHASHREISDDLKTLVSFRLLNLNAPNWPMSGKFDIIFCRNTVIYFDEETQAAVWSKFKQKMTDGAYIYIGHSERISGRDETCFSKAGITIYQVNT